MMLLEIYPNTLKCINNTTFNKVYHLSNAKVRIDNYRKPLGIKKGKIKRIYRLSMLHWASNQ